MNDATTRRRRRMAREALARWEANRSSRAGPPPDNSTLLAWIASALGRDSDVRAPFGEHPGVFRAVSSIVEAMGSVAWKLWTGTTEDDRREVQTGPWYDLLSDPSPDFDFASIWSVTRTWTCVDGEAFWILRARDGALADPRQIPGMIEPVRGTGMRELFHPETRAFIGWELERGGGRGKLRLLREQVVHFRPIPDPENPLRGLAPLSPLRRSIRTDAKARQWTEASLDNGCEPGVVLEQDKDAQMLQDEQIKQIRQQWEAMHGGAGNARRMAVVTGGMKVQTVGWSPKDMEYGEQRRWSRYEIASAYGVPLMLMGDMSEVHSKESARTVLRLFWENTVRPRLVAEQQALDRQLFRGRGQGDTATTQRIWPEPDLASVAILQAEESERRANAEVDRRLGFSLDEINARHELGYEPKQPAGDVGLVSGGLVPVTAVGFQFPDEEPPGPVSEPEDEPAEDPDDGGDDDAGRATHSVLVVTRAGPITKSPGPEERAILWHQYHRGIQRPGEQRMRTAVLAWMRDIRREVLRFVERAGRSVRTLTEYELSVFLAQKEEEWDEAILGKTAPVTEWIVAQSLARLAAQVGADMPNATSPRMLDFMRRMGARKVTRVSETMKTAIRSELMEGIGMRENITALQARVKGVMNAGASRSLAIARTETGTASTGSRWEAATERADKAPRKQWLSSRDDEVRDEHQIDGEERALEEPFSNTLMYPLDVDAKDAGLVVNCRCDWIPIRPEITIL